MAGSPSTIPIIDIFAGPGGLSEGFHSAKTAQHGLRFSSVLSIEKGPVACQTLRPRNFFRRFFPGRVPDAYYRFNVAGVTQIRSGAAQPLPGRGYQVFRLPAGVSPLWSQSVSAPFLCGDQQQASPLVG